MPDSRAIAEINLLTAELKARHAMRGRPIVDAKLHATLCNLGDFPRLPASLIARAEQAAASVAATTREFDVVFDTAQTFVNRSRDRPFVLAGGEGVAGLLALYKNLAQALLKVGIAGNPSSYTPHITMLYDDVTASPKRVPAIQWTVRELVLLHSRIGQSQPAYAKLARWPLGMI